MDRAAKVKKYRKKMTKKRNTYPAFGTPGSGFQGAGLVSAGIVAAGALIALFMVLHQKSRTAELAYVTQEEFTSLMSFLTEDPLPGQWQKDSDTAVTGGQLKDFVRDIGLSGVVTVTGGNDKLGRAAVMDCYEQILDYLDLGKAVRRDTILLLSCDGNSCQTKDGELKLNVHSLNLEPFHTYSAYLMGKTLLGVRAESDKTLALRQVQVRSVTDHEIGFGYQKKEYQIACEDTGELRASQSCTLCIKGGKVTKVKSIEGDAAGGGEEKAQALPETARALPKTVKVLLLNNGAIHYKQVYLMGDTGCSVKKDKKKLKYKKSDVVQVKKLQVKKGSYLIAEPAKSSGKLFLADRKGNKISNGYYGSLIVYRDKEGYYIVNKVNIEKYLYSVVASEMPSYFAIEALKAQAVCARSYVYRQMAANDHQKYHAQIDDSTNYQVYNKSKASSVDVQAVKATAGEVMYAQGGIVNAYYFSSSHGYTSGMEIWNQDEADHPYLRAKSLDPSEKGNTKFDLSDEASFKAFITSQKAASYDDGSRYYRWTAKVEPSACLKELKERIRQRREINPGNVTLYSTAGNKAKKVPSLKGFGGFKKLYCAKRGKSGAVLTLTIVFEFGKANIKSEYNIRSVLGCALEQITYADGGTDTDSRFLPSAYFSISFQEKSRRYLLSGGGNGHGMGMSQYGADGMAKAGWDYKKILRFYYDGIEIKKRS